VGGREVAAFVRFKLREEVLERLRHSPGEEARHESAPTPEGPPPSRWTLRTIRATFKMVENYTLSGVWRWLQNRVGVKLRSGHVQHFSPDPKYKTKVANLKRCLKAVARNPQETVLLFIDEMGYATWPDPAPDWVPDALADAPEADRQKSNNGLWRVIGGLNAWTGKVTFLDNYIVGRRKVIEMYDRIAKAHPRAKTIYVVQDNWSIHTHPDVLMALKAYPQIEPIWLPTYAPWLNPIEKLWRWLKETVTKMHRLANKFPALRQRVNDFLKQFARGSRKLLRYVGLLGDGQLAQALRFP
jgi:transposase